MDSLPDNLESRNNDLVATSKVRVVGSSSPPPVPDAALSWGYTPISRKRPAAFPPPPPQEDAELTVVTPSDLDYDATSNGTPQRAVTRACMRQGIQSFIKQENIQQGDIQCPVCYQVICVADKGCNVVTCRNHQPQYVYFCVHCKKVNKTEYAICTCPKRNTRVTRAQAQTERNRLAKESPIEIDLSSSSPSTDDEDENDIDDSPKHDEQKKQLAARDFSESQADGAENADGDDENDEVKNEAMDSEVDEHKMSANGFSETNDPKENSQRKTNRVEVEFMFRSHKSLIFQEGVHLQGTLHISMNQDPITGLYSIPVGQSTFRATLSDEVETPLCWCRFTAETKHFTGSFTRKTAEGKIDMDPGISLAFNYGRMFPSLTLCVRPSDAPNLNKMNTLEMMKTDSFGVKSFETLNPVDEWEKEQGGFIDLFVHVVLLDRYETSLYTALSAHKPNEKGDYLPKYKKGQIPDWPALVRVVNARNPNKNHSWAERAVQQYRYFLDLKVNKSQLQIAPSIAIDKIWDAHLSFLDKYQHDVICLTKGGPIIERTTINVKHARQHVRNGWLSQERRCYIAGFLAHWKRMAELGLPVDKEFWPKPEEELKLFLREFF